MWKRIAKRFGRVALSVVIAGVISYVSNTPYALALAPVLNALGKWARERGFDYIPV